MSHSINILYSESESDSLVTSEEEVEPLPDKQTPISQIDMVLPDRIGVVGGSESGKTTVIRNLLQSMVKNHKVICIWWLGSNSDDEKWLPAKYRRKEISQPLMDNIRRSQLNPAMKDCHQIIVLDDIIGERFHKNPWWDQYISTCRHERITLIFGIQYLKSVSPCIRENFKRFIVCHSTNQTLSNLYQLSSVANKHKWVEQFAGIKLGSPILLDVRPGKQELVELSVPKCESVKYSR
jgi:GTPase SAR1 family protein